jgi:hypothetical protein
MACIVVKHIWKMDKANFGIIYRSYLFGTKNLVHPYEMYFLAQHNVFLILLIYVKRSHNSRTPPLPKSRDCTAFLVTTRGIGASYHRHDRSNIRSETPGVRAFRNLWTPPPSSAEGSEVTALFAPSSSRPSLERKWLRRSARYVFAL